VASQVSDTGNTFVAAGALGTFSVNIAANPPTIASLSDSPDPVIRPGNLTLTANGVTGGAGTVNLVEFYRDSNNNGLLDIGTDALLGSDTDSTGGWSLAVSTLGSPLGTNRYFARAQTIDGFWSNLVSATGIVNNGNPTIDSLSATPDPVTRGTDVTLTANNTIDAEGSIAKVEFYRDSNENGTFELGTDTLLGSDANSAGGWTFITSSLALKLAPGTNRFFARATDNDGGVSTATTTGVVNNVNPLIGSLSPTPDPVTRGQNITLTANNVTDADGTVAKVEFYRDTNGNGTLEVGTDALLGSDTSSTGGWTLTTSTTDYSLGTITYLARAADNLNAWSDTETITGTVDDVFPVIGSLSVLPTLIAPGRNLTLTAIIASDNDSVAKVEFYRDSNNNGTLEVGTDALLGSDTTPADGWKWTGAAGSTLGTEQYLARAQDGDGDWSPIAKTTSTVALPCAVSGTLFNDLNGNGRKDARESALSNWRVFIDQDGDGRLDRGEQTVITDSHGRWTLNPALFGTTRIRAVLKTGWKFTAPKNGLLTVKLNTTQCAPAKLFGVRRI